MRISVTLTITNHIIGHRFKYININIKWNRENFQIRINESKLVYIMVFDAKSRFYFRILRGFMN